jgi:hypothetical protein
VAERDRIQPGEFVAALGAAEGDRDVVLDQLAATAGEDWRPVGKACPLLLLLLAESHLIRRLIGSMPQRIEALPGASGSLALERMQTKIVAAATGGILTSPAQQNGNPS